MSARSMDVRRLPCLACEQEGVEQPSPTESHHQNLDQHAGQKRLGDHAQVPLCGWHHRAVRPVGMSYDTMTGLYGPSLSLDPIQFREAYGSDAVQRANTDAQLARLLPATA